MNKISQSLKEIPEKFRVVVVTGAAITWIGVVLGIPYFIFGFRGWALALFVLIGAGVLAIGFCLEGDSEN